MAGAPPRHPRNRPAPDPREVGRWRWRVRLAGLVSAFWLLLLLSLVLEAVLEYGNPTSEAPWFFQAVLTLALAGILWRWWRQLYDERPTRPGRPPELDEPPGPHLGRGGEVEPPTRW